MKKIILLIPVIAFLTCATLFSQVADGISYQAVALDDKGKEIAGRDINGLIIHSKDIGVKFSILKDSPDGEVLYCEQHSTYTDPHGLFSLVIGHGEVLSNGLFESLLDISWGENLLFLKVEIDIKNRGNYKLMGIQQMMAVPFAFHAFSSTTTENIEYEEILNTPELSDVATTGEFDDLLNVPTTLDGFGITDAMSTGHAANGIAAADITNWNSAFAWGDHAGLYRPVSYVPDWSEITTVPFLFTVPEDAQLLRYNVGSGRWENWTPNYLTSYTETDPVWAAEAGNYYTITDIQADYYTISDIQANYYARNDLQSAGGAQVHFSNLSSKPTTLAGYGITDAVAASHPANAISAGDITNWTTAYGWGDHTGLYRSASYVPDWSEITSMPFAFSSPANAELIRYNGGTGQWENWAPNYLTSFTETDPLWTASASNYYTISEIQANYYSISDIQANYYTRNDLQSAGAVNIHFSNLSNTPTTLAGYGITDAMTTSHPANAISGADIANWTTAYGWGDHTSAGYEPGIIAGGVNEYLRGDKTWQVLDKAAVGLGNVEDIPLSGWPGSPSIGIVGNIIAGEWNAGRIQTGDEVLASAFIRWGGSPNEFLKADGSVDANTYLTEVREAADEFSAAAGQTSFTLSQTPSAAGKVKMYVNGIRISNSAYSHTGNALTYNSSNNGSYDLSAGDRVQFDYTY